ncbi:MAG: AMP-binding protein, partial [Ardenticatenales bacterium]
MPPAPHADACLHEIFLAVAGRHPDRIAIEVPAGGADGTDVRVSYAQLAARASDCAAALDGLVGPDARVAVLLPRDGAALYVAQLGALVAGGAFVGLDVAFPDTHIGRLLADAAPVAVLTDAAGRARLERIADAPAEGSAADPRIGWRGPIIVVDDVQRGSRLVAPPPPASST